MKRDEDGFEIETDFEIEHRSVNSCYCEECETKLYDTVQLPEDIYKKLYSVVTSRKGDNHIFYVDLENVNAIKPEDVKALLVAALI
jgi:ribosomal protein L20A (L18A)